MSEILIKYFKPIVDNFKYSKELNSYILSVLIEIKKNNDFSKDSLTLKYIEAQRKYNFQLYQSLGDWILFCQINMPDHLKHAEEVYYNAIAQNCYYSCYRLLNRQWKLFEELADTYPNVISDLRVSSNKQRFFNNTICR